MREAPMPSEPGKCYAKCLIQDKVLEKKFVGDFLVYTGEDVEKEGVTYREIITKEAGTRWEKKKADRNCLSPNPEDCMVWCLIEVPEESALFYEVTDTSLVKEYKLEAIYTTPIAKKGGYTEWKEVICESDISPALYTKIQENLSVKGYNIGNDNKGKMSSTTQAALKEFQIDYALPIGGLNIETMEALGVDY